MPFDVKRRFFANSHTDAVDFHPTQPWLLTGNSYGDIQIYNLESGKTIHIFRLNSALSAPPTPVTITCVRFIARNNWYVVGSQDGYLRFFSCTTHKMVLDFKAHTKDITCIAVHPTSPILLTAGRDNRIESWSWDKRWSNLRVRNASLTPPPITDENPDRWIMSVAFNPKDPDTFASASLDGTVNLWSIASPIPLFTLKAHDTHVNSVDFYPGADKPYLVTASNDNTVKIWDYVSRSCVQTIAGHTMGVSFAVFHPSLPIIISGSLDCTVKVWNNEVHRLENTLSCELGWARCIAFGKDRSEVAVGFDKAVITLEFTPSVPFPMAASRGDFNHETLKEQVLKSAKDPDMKDPAINIITDTEHEIELAQSQESLISTSDIVHALGPASITPESLEAHPHEVDPYQKCITLAMELVVMKVAKKLISDLRDDKARDMVEFLSKMINEEVSLTPHDRKHALYLLSKLSKSAQIFPRSLELEDVQFDPTNPFTWGGYGVIFQGSYYGGQVCVKVVQIALQGNDEKKLRQAHASELTIWAHLKHPNVLPLLGIYPSQGGVPRICMVSPWMVNGDLLQYLGKVPDAPRKPLVHNIISGLQYLHDLDIIHADLKAKNVLVSETGKAMLADFGISRLSITLTTMSANVSTGTAYWMAAELHLDDDPRPSREADIWAFACTCYEVVTGITPFGQYHNPVVLIGAFLRGKIIPVKPAKVGIGWDDDVWSVAMRCWQRDPATRPRAHELLDMMDNFNCLDDCPSEHEFQRNAATVDYDRIISILDKIRQSANEDGQ